MKVAQQGTNAPTSFYTISMLSQILLTKKRKKENFCRLPNFVGLFYRILQIGQEYLYILRMQVTVHTLKYQTATKVKSST